MSTTTDATRDALAELIDKKLDGDCGYGIGVYLADAIIAAGLGQVHDVLAEVSSVERPSGATHYESCYRNHAGCLASLLEGLLGEPSSVEVAHTDDKR